MEALVPLLVLVLFSVLAYRFGYDSRPQAGSPEETLANGGVLIDHETTTVMPDEITSASPSASKTAGRAFLRAG